MAFLHPRLHLLKAALVAIALTMSLPMTGGAADTPGKNQRGPRFELVDQRGRPVGDRELADKPTIVHFGFTHCPVICPTTLFELSEYMRELGPTAERFNFVFVSIDPERDTQQLLNAYLDSFDSRILALTGSAADVKALADGLGATFARHSLDDGSFTYDHTVYGYLLSAGWMKQGHVYMGTGSRRSVVLQRLHRLSQTASN